MSNNLKEAAKLIQENKEEEARIMLEEILRDNAGNDEAWVWLASITANREERKGYLEEALKYNPRNQLALTSLQKMGAKIETQSKNIPIVAHILSGWPFILILVGGAIGGALGGAAYAINLSIYKSRLPSAVKIVLNPVVGIAAFVIWFAFSLFIREALAK